MHRLGRGSEEGCISCCKVRVGDRLICLRAYVTLIVAGTSSCSLFISLMIIGAPCPASTHYIRSDGSRITHYRSCSICYRMTGRLMCLLVCLMRCEMCIYKANSVARICGRPLKSFRDEKTAMRAVGPACLNVDSGYPTDVRRQGLACQAQQYQCQHKRSRHPRRQAHSTALLVATMRCFPGGCTPGLVER